MTLLEMDTDLSAPEQIVLSEEADISQFQDLQRGNAFKKNIRNELASTG